jgi:flagellar motor switch protein FliN/FliY
MKKKQPFFWLRKVASEIQQHDQIPLFGHAPSFDWEKASNAISERLGISVTISPAAQKMRSADEIEEGLGDNPLVLPLKAGPFDGSAYWICPKASVTKLTKPLTGADLAEGYYRYLLLQVLDTLSSLPPFQTVSFVLSESTPLPQTDAYCIDIEITYNDQAIWGRLAIDPDLKKSWALHYSSSPEYFLPLHSGAELIVGVKVGGIKLTQPEWEGLEGGDFIPLGRSGYNPRKHEGAAYLMLRETPLFEIKIKNNKIELIDYPHTYEEMMEDNIPHESLQLPPAEEQAVKDLPVYLTVELARYRITLEKLMQLSPGNQLELPIHPDQAVQLTVNGQLVGHAELVHLGDTLGIRILDMK